MKLRDDFFKLLSVTEEQGEGRIAQIELNPDHVIFACHFPNNPVTPGVCIIQIVKELLEEEFACRFLIIRIVSVKFLKVINPIQSRKINIMYSIDKKNDDEIKVMSSVFDSEYTFSKISLIITKNK